MYSFFIINSPSKNSGFLLQDKELIGKMDLFISNIQEQVSYPDFSLIKFHNFVLEKINESDGNVKTILKLNFNEIIHTMNLTEDDYLRFKNTHLILPYSLKDKITGASGKTYYYIEPQITTYQKGGIAIPGYPDPDSDTSSDLGDYDIDGNYVYEDNSNPTNSAYFNRSDIDFLQNN